MCTWHFHVHPLQLPGSTGSDSSVRGHSPLLRCVRGAGAHPGNLQECKVASEWACLGQGCTHWWQPSTVLGSLWSCICLCLSLIPPMAGAATPPPPPKLTSGPSAGEGRSTGLERPWRVGPSPSTSSLPSGAPVSCSGQATSLLAATTRAQLVVLEREPVLGTPRLKAPPGVV